MENATHVVSLGGERHLVNADSFKTTCDALVAKHGGIPKVDPIADAPQPAPVAAIVPATPGPGVVSAAAPLVRGVTVVAAGAARSEEDKLLAQMNGFAPAQPFFTRGTAVIEWGVDNARQSRLDHEAKPLVEQSCVEFIQRIQAEQRRDDLVPMRHLRMNVKGQLCVSPGDGAPVMAGDLSRRGFRSLLSQADIGGHEYLSGVPAKLRAINVNNHLAGIDGLPIPAGDIKLRTRRSAGATGREVFAVVSPKYTSFDAHLIAAELMTAVEGTEARGAVLYDGERARFEALWHSNVQPEDYVAGEFFKAGILVRTADDGSGSCRVSAVVWQNLCLNLIVIDEADQEIARIRHVGKQESMAARLRLALEQAQEKVAGFVVKWGYACRDVLVLPEGHPLSIEDAIPGFFNGVIERELVPVRGKRQDVVRSLVEMYGKDESSATRNGFTRAALANAFTRWAHEVNTDPWLQDDVQRAAGVLVQSTTPLPFEPISLKA